jgi:hypothetical protein
MRQALRCWFLETLNNLANLIPSDGDYAVDIIPFPTEVEQPSTTRTNDDPGKIIPFPTQTTRSKKNRRYL